MSLSLSPDVQSLFDQAMQHHEAGELEAAVQGYEAVLTVMPEHADSWHLLGLVALEQSMPQEALGFIAQAISLDAGQPFYHMNLAKAQEALGDVSGAIESLQRATGLGQTEAGHASLAAQTGQVDIANSLQAAIRHQQQGQLIEAEQVCLAILACEPQQADALHLLGVVCSQQQRLDEAAVLIAQAVALAPHAVQFHINLGMVYQAQGEHSLAADSFAQALALTPDAVEVRLALINALREAKRYTEAVPLFDPLLAAQPMSVDVRYNAGLLRWLAKDLHGALADFVHCLKLDEQFFDAHHAMVWVLETEPDHTMALKAFNDILAKYPLAPELHSVLAYASDFDPTLDAAGQQHVRKDYYQQQIVPQKIQALKLKVKADPDKKLRIGFIPGRFYRNASAYAYLPILLQLPREEFEVWCYDNFPFADDFTGQIKARADGWCDITKLSNAEAAQRIRDDQIDILIDLFAHAGANRLPIYAYRPAPIQVTAWGHANGTGMAAMDYLFSDPVSVPPEEVGLYAEHVHYLPCQLSYWLPETAPPLAPLPMVHKGYVTFGCFNRMIKISDAVFELWMQLMAAVPNSRLVLKTPDLQEPLQRERVIRMFERHSISTTRLDMEFGTPWYDHLQRYADVDIALDPFPMGGGVTTLDALWMGIPVVCLRGHTLGQRITSAIMTAVGLPDWVSDTPQGYLQLVQDKARDVQGLQQLRASMRMRMAASPLANPDYYVGCVEDALRSFWRTWCASPESRLPQPREAKFAIGEHARAADQLWQDFLAKPDSPDVRHRLADSMRRAGKNVLAAEFLARAD